jgi:hypothetical protein
MEYINALDSHIEKTMSPFKKTFYLKGVLHLLIVLYAAKLAPALPLEVLSLFENQYFKLLIFSLILWTAQFSPSTAILISVAFMVSMNAVNKKALWEFLENENEYEKKVEYLENTSAPAAVPAQVVEISPAQSIEAVKVLAQAASSNEASPPSVISNVANIAAANVTTEAGANALKQLVEQAMVSSSGSTQKVDEAVKKVVESIPPPPPPPVPAPIPQIAQKVAISEPASAPPSAPSSAGCYPIRRYDMSKVVSAKPSDNSSNPVFEDHQSWPN